MDNTIFFGNDGGLGLGSTAYDGMPLIVEALEPGTNGSTITLTITCAGYLGD